MRRLQFVVKYAEEDLSKLFALSNIIKNGIGLWTLFFIKDGKICFYMESYSSMEVCTLSYSLLKCFTTKYIGIVNNNLHV